MDREWMAAKLNEFALVAEVYNELLESPYSTNVNQLQVKDAYQRQVPTAKRILQQLDPPLGSFRVGNPRDAARDARMGLGILADWDDVAAKLLPDSPTMRADALHPWVWDAARTFWESDHWRGAVQTAASAVNAHTQQKVGRTDVSDDVLMNQSFSADPPELGKPRLRLPGDRSDLTWKSRQGGTRSMAQACFAAVRNPATHEHDEWDQQIALESLAALSLLARWIEECEVETAE